MTTDSRAHSQRTNQRVDEKQDAFHRSATSESYERTTSSSPTAVLRVALDCTVRLWRCECPTRHCDPPTHTGARRSDARAVESAAPKSLRVLFSDPSRRRGRASWTERGSGAGANTWHDEVRLQGHVLFVGAVVIALRRKRGNRRSRAQKTRAGDDLFSRKPTAIVPRHRVVRSPGYASWGKVNPSYAAHARPTQMTSYFRNMSERTCSRIDWFQLVPACAALAPRR